MTVTSVQGLMDDAIKTRSDVYACLELFTSDQVLFVRQGERSYGRRDESER